MSNDYFNNSATLINGSTAFGSDVETKFDAVTTAFAKLPGETELIRGKVGVADDNGVVNAYACTMHKTITSYVDDMEVVVKIANANTAEACTLNVDSVGVKSIKTSDGNNPAIGALNSYAHLRYDDDNGYFVLLSSATHEDRIKALATSIAALLAGSGCPVSSNDTSAGFLNGKLVAGTNISLTENNDGGNETLSVSLVSSPILKGNLDCAGYEVEEANMVGDTGKVTTLTASTQTTPGEIELDVSQCVTAVITVDQNVTAFTITGWPASGTEAIRVLRLNFTGAYTCVYPTGSEFPGGASYDFTDSGEDEFTLTTRDGGTTIDWSLRGQDFGAAV